MSVKRGFRMIRRLLILVAMVAVAIPAQAQTTRYILKNATGLANGTSWQNAYTDVQTAINNFTRGDTVYIGASTGGTYVCNPRCAFNTADSGTTLITVKGAIASDHGAASDWQASYGVDVTPATFTSGQACCPFDALIRMDTDYWVFDGNIRTGYESGYGFIVDNSYPNSMAFAILASFNSLITQNVTIRRVWTKGAGLDINNGENTTLVTATCSGGNTAVIVSLTNSTAWHIPYVGKWITVTGVTGGSGFNIGGTGVQISQVTDITHWSYPATCSGSGTGGNVVGPMRAGEVLINASIGAANTGNHLFDRVYGSNSSNDCWDWAGQPSTILVTIQYSECNANSNNTMNHGQAGGGAGGSGVGGVTLAYNILKDIEGTSVFQFEAATGQFSNNLQIYGNVWVVSSGNPTGRYGVGNGFVLCGANATCNNITIANNSFINVGATGQGSNLVWSFAPNGGNSCDTVKVVNNLFYASTPVNDNPSTCTTYSRTNNSWLNTTGYTQLNSGDVADQSAPNPFVNWPGRDYHLATNNIDWNGGLSLAAPYNMDPDGVTRGSPNWSVGAFQFVGNQQSQTITFSSIPNHLLTDPPFTVNATASSGLTVSFSSKTPSTCTLVDNGNGTATITLIAVGTCTIAANQAGNASFSAAPEVDRSFSILRPTNFLKKSPNGNYPAGTIFPVQVQLVDVNNNPVSSIAVTLTVTRGSGMITPAMATTDSNGMITATVTLDSNPGLNTFVIATGTTTYVLNAAGF